MRDGGGTGAPGPGMPVGGLDLPPEARGLLEGMHKRLYPMQADTVKAGLLEGRSVLVSAPTSGGKTLVALMATLACLSRGAGRVVYLCPMRSLATEQYRELKRLESIKINGRAPRVAMTMGEHGADGRALGDADVVVMTNERLDALMRQDEKWRGRTGLVVVDEVHMIGDAGRGPALETVIAHAMSMDRPPQIVGLSATAPNAKELADWLGATLVKSCWRPVRLVEGIYDGHEVHIDVAEPLRVETAAGYTAALRAGIASAMRDQTILFAGTRPSAVSMAKKAAGALEGRVRKEDRERLAKYSARIKGGSKPTGEVTALIGLVGRGVAFHHAGLDQNCKDAVEAGFRDRAIRLVVSTPTLAVGVNLPARRVIISSLSRYQGKAGHQEISVREYMQMAGRAGRPQYDDSGEAIIVTTPEKAGHARARYIEGEPEPVRSQMAGAEPMRAHLLGLVAIYPGIREGKVLEFFLRTLAGMQMGSARMAQVVGDGLQFLCECGFITAEATEGPPSYHPTAMGRRVTRMYLEPSAALKMIRMARMETSGAAHTLGLAYAAVTYGKARKNGIRRQDAEPLGSLLDGHSDELFKRIVDRESDPPERSTLALWHWLEERSEEHIADTFGIESGELRRLRDDAGRAIRQIGAISKLVGNTALADEADALGERTKYGIRAELLDLAGLRGIGRAYARKLHDAGFGDRAALRGLSPRKMAQITGMGKKTAEGILAQVAGKQG